MVSLIASKQCLLICFVFTSLTDTIGTTTLKPSVLKKTSFLQWPWTISISDWINTNGNRTYYNNYTTPSGDGVVTITSFKWTTSLRPTLLKIKTSESNKISNQVDKSRSNGNSTQTGTSRSNGNSNQTGASGSKGNLYQTGTDLTNTTVKTPITVAATTIGKTVTTLRTTTSPNCRILVPRVINYSFKWHKFIVGEEGIYYHDLTFTEFTADKRTDVCKPTSPRFITRRYRSFNTVRMVTDVNGRYYTWTIVNCKKPYNNSCHPTLNISLPLKESYTRIMFYFSDGRDKTSLAIVLAYYTTKKAKPKMKVISETIGFVTNGESMNLLKILKSRYLRYYKLIRRHLNGNQVQSQVEDRNTIDSFETPLMSTVGMKNRKKARYWGQNESVVFLN